jgi:predicted TIM-barrel fold metal-dependent hydrolase
MGWLRSCLGLSRTKISITPEAFRRSIARISELGWFAKIFTLGGELIEHRDLFDGLKIPVVVDHMGGLEFAQGLNQQGMLMMRDYLKRGNWWVMVSSGDRHALGGYPWDEAVPFAQSLIETAPDRIVWGTDWPHVIYDGKMPNDCDLLELFYRYAPDAALRKRLLIDNPETLFQFPPARPRQILGAPPAAR